MTFYIEYALTEMFWIQDYDKINGFRQITIKLFVGALLAPIKENNALTLTLSRIVNYNKDEI